ncbi:MULTISPECIES: hypothetical protein [Hyphomicrobium]|jgi:hypothetical protein|uniref:hypothetical protein n=1 Tax=Hyphomicrobium TaxID=81 RepID=UPI000A4F3BEE|nr:MULTISPECIES: hypothetical protein [Hyphomicrobium]HRN88992.1 hypothetical protein [Hyphomicrobium sp.]HRQ27508.1 hypothetical protein [Hyphomicrobium sp.]
MSNITIHIRYPNFNPSRQIAKDELFSFPEGDWTPGDEFTGLFPSVAAACRLVALRVDWKAVRVRSNLKVEQTRGA